MALADLMGADARPPALHALVPWVVMLAYARPRTLCTGSFGGHARISAIRLSPYTGPCGACGDICLTHALSLDLGMLAYLRCPAFPAMDLAALVGAYA